MAIRHRLLRGSDVMEPQSAQDILRRYGRHFSEGFDAQYTLMSKEYLTFRQEALQKKVTLYESLCQFSASVLKVRPAEKDQAALKRAIDVAHLDITPEGAASFAALTALSIIFLGVLVGVGGYLLAGELYLFWPLTLMLGGALLIKPFSKIPLYLETQWRLAVSNQMVVCILYVVMYMRHTSNLEHAIKFAGEHVGLPLGLDLKKILWNIETGTYVTIHDSLEVYLRQWVDHNQEFVESFHLIEGSLYEPQEAKRIAVLEKALQVILDGTYEHMLHYAHNLQSPITMLHMFGVILPVLGLVIFPLLGSFMGGAIRWYHLAFLYNILIPLLVFFYGAKMMKRRPTGYGQGDTVQAYPELQQQRHAESVKTLALLLTFGFLLVGFLPLLLHVFAPSFEFEAAGWKLQDYKGDQGPYGLWAVFFSFLIPLGLAFGMGMYYLAKNKRVIEISKKTDLLEKEFSGALFQLGNRVGDGMPAEVAIGKVAENMRGSSSGEFLLIADTNMRKLGMGLRDALFDKRVGAVLFFPSHLIQSSMKILVESSKKGLSIVSSSLVTISQYVDRIRQVNERLKDLMADVSSSMLSQIHFMTPVIAGIVVGVGTMVGTIINLLETQFSAVSAEGSVGVGGLGVLGGVLNIRDVIPGFYFQAIVGVYVVQMIAILTILSTTLERGVDHTVTEYRMGKNLIRSTVFYVVVALISVVIFNVLASAVGTVNV